jgi:hypothetical protein
MASTFLGLDRCERKLFGKFPSYFEKIQKIKCKIKGIPKNLWTHDFSGKIRRVKSNPHSKIDPIMSED